jgi:hypothetical protein
MVANSNMFKSGWRTARVCNPCDLVSDDNSQAHSQIVLRMGLN